MGTKIVMGIVAAILLSCPGECYLSGWGSPNQASYTKYSPRAYNNNPYLNSYTGGQTPGNYVKSLIYKNEYPMSIKPSTTAQQQKNIQNLRFYRYPSSNTKQTQNFQISTNPSGATIKTNINSWASENKNIPVVFNPSSIRDSSLRRAQK